MAVQRTSGGSTTTQDVETADGTETDTADADRDRGGRLQADLRRRLEAVRDRATTGGGGGGAGGGTGGGVRERTTELERALDDADDTSGRPTQGQDDGAQTGGGRRFAGEALAEPVDGAGRTEAPGRGGDGRTGMGGGRRFAGEALAEPVDGAGRTGMTDETGGGLRTDAGMDGRGDSAAASPGRGRGLRERLVAGRDELQQRLAAMAAAADGSEPPATEDADAGGGRMFPGADTVFVTLDGRRVEVPRAVARNLKGTRFFRSEDTQQLIDERAAALKQEIIEDNPGFNIERSDIDVTATRQADGGFRLTAEVTGDVERADIAGVEQRVAARDEFEGVESGAVGEGGRQAAAAVASLEGPELAGQGPSDPEQTTFTPEQVEAIQQRAVARRELARTDFMIRQMEQGRATNPELTGGYPARIIESAVESQNEGFEVDVTRQPGYGVGIRVQDRPPRGFKGPFGDEFTAGIEQSRQNLVGISSALGDVAPRPVTGTAENILIGGRGVSQRVRFGVRDTIPDALTNIDATAALSTTASAAVVAPEPISSGTGALVLGGLAAGSVAASTLSKLRGEKPTLEEPEIPTPTDSAVRETEIKIPEDRTAFSVSELGIPDEVVRERSEIQVTGGELDRETGEIQIPDDTDRVLFRATQATAAGVKQEADEEEEDEEDEEDDVDEEEEVAIEVPPEFIPEETQTLGTVEEATEDTEDAEADEDVDDTADELVEPAEDAVEPAIERTEYYQDTDQPDEIETDTEFERGLIESVGYPSVVAEAMVSTEVEGDKTPPVAAARTRTSEDTDATFQSQSEAEFSTQMPMQNVGEQLLEEQVLERLDLREELVQLQDLDLQKGLKVATPTEPLFPEEFAPGFGQPAITAPGFGQSTTTRPPRRRRPPLPEDEPVGDSARQRVRDDVAVFESGIADVQDLLADAEAGGLLDDIDVLADGEFE